MKAFQAYAKESRVTRDTPRDAAIAFFEKYPNKRKCSVIEGETDGQFFTISYGRASEGNWPASWKDVTRKTALELPE